MLKEMAKRMIELCDGSLQGMASTMNLLAYYNDIFGGALKHELEMLNGIMASKLCEAKNDVKGLDLECRFDGKSNGPVRQPERLNDPNDLTGLLTTEMIPMSDIVAGFKRMSSLESRDELVKIYKSLNTMLIHNKVWAKYTGEIERIFVEVNKNTTYPSVNYNYGPGANHYDSHKEVRINNENSNLLK